MASYVKRLHDAGVRLNVGTDTPEPGKSVLSEMLLLHEAGISMPDVFHIATMESAQGIGHEAEYGSVTVGKRADFILFDGDLLTRPRDLPGGKTVIKDGVVFHWNSFRSECHDVRAFIVAFLPCIFIACLWARRVQ